jgi:mannose-6-phosphate isomerase-like protein (cupin superfamily)
MDDVAISNSSRRNFLRAVPVAAASLTLAGSSRLTLLAAAESPQANGTPPMFQLLTADSIDGDLKARSAKPGHNTLFQGTFLSVVVECETLETNEGPEFQLHEEHDHVIQIYSGSTVYDVGGTLKDGHTIRPREWRAPAAEGTTKVTLNKGDMLVIPRNTPHRRFTAGAVTFTMITWEPPKA